LRLLQDPKTDRELHVHEFDIFTTIRDGPTNNG
jgi:hypothetical protein